MQRMSVITMATVFMSPTMMKPAARWNHYLVTEASGILRRTFHWKVEWPKTVNSVTEASEILRRNQFSFTAAEWPTAVTQRHPHTSGDDCRGEQPSQRLLLRPERHGELLDPRDLDILAQALHHPRRTSQDTER
jgi:hypothetical protein